MIGWLEGKTVWAKQDLWLAVDGESVFVAEGEAFNSRSRIVTLWPEVFSTELPKIKEAI